MSISGLRGAAGRKTSSVDWSRSACRGRICRDFRVRETGSRMPTACATPGRIPRTTSDCRTLLRGSNPVALTENDQPRQRLIDLPAVDLRRLRYFAAVAEELSFSRAADRLGLSQQALSRQVRHLEDQVGRSLFFRTTRRVELTAAGRALLPKAQLSLAAALDALDTARAAEPESRYTPWL